MVAFKSKAKKMNNIHHNVESSEECIDRLLKIFLMIGAIQEN